MTNVNLEKVLRKIIKEEHGLLHAEMQEEIKDSEERVTQKIIESEERTKIELTKKIQVTQEDTIDILSESIHKGYTNHEKQIPRIQHHLNLADK